jgi:hypothetical protein
MRDRAAKTALFDAFARAAKALATAYLGDRDQLGPVTREGLARRLQDGDPPGGPGVCGRPPSTPPGWPSPRA